MIGKDITTNSITKTLFEKRGIVAIIVSLIALIGTRIQGYSNIITEDGVSIQNSDLFLHLRNMEYISENWPVFLLQDNYLDYPANAVSQTLFDQIGGTLLLLNPDPSFARWLLVVLPLLFIGLSVPVLYVLTKNVFNKTVASVTVLIYPLLPSELYTTTVIGQSGSETLTLLLFLLALLTWVSVLSYVETEIYTISVLREQIEKRDVSSITVLSVLFAAATTMTLGALNFPISTEGSSAIVVYGFSTFVFINLYVFIRGLFKSYIEPVVLITAIVSGLVTLHTMNVIFGVITALSILYLVGNMALNEKSSDFQKSVLTTVSGLALVGGVSVLYFFTDSAIISNLFSVFESGAVSSNYSTLQSGLWQQYGAVFIPASIGFIILSWKRVFVDYVEAKTVFVYAAALVTSIVAVYHTEVNMYMTVFISMFAAYGIYYTLVSLDINSTPVRQYKGYQIAAVFTVIILFVPVILYPISGTVFTENTASPTIEYQDTSEWLQENTSSPGEYTQNTDPSYGIINNQQFGYPLSYQSERAVVGTQSNRVLNGLSAYLTANPSNTDPKTAFTESENVQSDQFNDRYVVLDWRSVSSEFEFGEYTQNIDESSSEYYTPLYTRNGQYGTSVYNDKYYQSLATKLYHYHGSAIEQSPVVMQTERTQQGFLSTPGDIRRSEALRTFESMSEAEEFVQENNGQIGGIMSNPTTEVDHVENYRLVHLSDNRVTEDQLFNQLAGSLIQYNEDLQYSDLIIHPSSVKTFEKVEGATLTGSNAAPNSTVTAQLQLNLPDQENPLVYRAETEADSDGNYSITVPYSTTGYDEYTAQDGYTNPDITAQSGYTVINRPDEGTPRTSQVQVTEGQIYGEEENTIQVELSQPSISSLIGSQGSGNTITTNTGE